MSHVRRVAKVLRQNTKGSGIKISTLARLARVPRESVSKRVYDLRQEENRVIYTNYKNGETYYRLAA